MQRYTLDAQITYISATLNSAYNLIIEVGYYCKNNIALINKYSRV